MAIATTKYSKNDQSWQQLSWTSTLIIQSQSARGLLVNIGAATTPATNADALSLSGNEKMDLTNRIPASTNVWVRADDTRPETAVFVVVA